MEQVAIWFYSIKNRQQKDKCSQRNNLCNLLFIRTSVIDPDFEN